MSAGSGKTIAQWLRNEVFKAMAGDVERLRATWPGSNAIAHRHEETGKVTFVLRLNGDGLDRLRAALGNVATSIVQHCGRATHVFRGEPDDMVQLLTALGVQR